MTRETRPAWPGGARCAVVVTVDLDAELFWLRLHPSAADRPKTLSLGTYGILRGTPRLLNLFDELGVPATWFVPGHTAQRHAETVREIHRRGQEIGCRAMGDEILADLDNEQIGTVVERSAEILRELTGVRPRGFRPPPGRVGDGLAPILAERGITWTSGMFGDDLPYFLEVGGRPTPVVEIPWRWEHADYPYFAYNSGVVSFPPGRSRIASYDAVLTEWTAAFDAYHDRGLCFVLTLEPQVIAKPGRFLLIEQLLTHICATPNVWLASGRSVADHWLTRAMTNDPAHPEHVRATWLRADSSKEPSNTATQP